MSDTSNHQCLDPSKRQMKDIYLLGGGGHAKVLIDCLRLTGRKLKGITDIEPDRVTVTGVPFLGPDKCLFEMDPEHVESVNGIGGAGDTSPREAVFQKFREKGYRFASVVHPFTTIAEGVAIGEGAQIMAGAILQPGVRIGINVIANARVCVNHDC